jgi:hypothetical protein
MAPEQKRVDLPQRETISSKRFDPDTATPFVKSQSQKKPAEPAVEQSQASSSSWAASTRLRYCRMTCSCGWIILEAV